MPSPEDLRREFEDLQVRIRQLEDRRRSISEGVYKKVKSEYQARIEQLENLLAGLEAATSEIEEAARGLMTKVRSAASDWEEALVRHELGEFTRDRLDELQRQIRQSTDLVLQDLSKKFSLLGRPIPKEIEAFAAMIRGAAKAAASAFHDAGTANQQKSTGKGETLGSEIEEELDTEDFEELGSLLPPDSGDDLPGVPGMENPFAPPKPKSSQAIPVGESLIDSAPPDNVTSKIPNSVRRMVENDPAGLRFRDIHKKRLDSQGRPRAGNLQLPVVRVLTPQMKDQMVSLKKEIIRVGRLPDNDIVITGDHAVSRYHAEIHTSRGGSQIVDLKSANGTLVNGSKIQSKKLACNDIVSVGRTTLIFIDDPDELRYYTQE